MNVKTTASKIVLPYFSNAMTAQDREIIQIFLNSMNSSKHHTDDSRILNAIYKTADLTGNSDAFITKFLVDQGLKAPRNALPADFLNHIDYVAMHKTQGLFTNITQSYQSLIQFWDDMCDQYAPNLNCGTDVNITHGASL